MHRYLLALGVLLMTPAASFANSLTLPIPDGVKASTVTTTYQCGKEPVKATYINAGSISLVELQFKKQVIVAANVIAASGAKYAGNEFIWWSVGDKATLYNLMDDPKQNHPVECKLKANTSK